MDEEIQSKCGIDATTYLSFQRHLLVLLMLVCVLSVAVILPVNFSGDLLGRCIPASGWHKHCTGGLEGKGPFHQLWFFRVVGACWEPGRWEDRRSKEGPQASFALQA